MEWMIVRQHPRTGERVLFRNRSAYRTFEGENLRALKVIASIFNSPPPETEGTESCGKMVVTKDELGYLLSDLERAADACRGAVCRPYKKGEGGELIPIEGPELTLKMDSRDEITARRINKKASYSRTPLYLLPDDVAMACHKHVILPTNRPLNLDDMSRLLSFAGRLQHILSTWKDNYTYKLCWRD